jgi:hypothetical protein
MLENINRKTKIIKHSLNYKKLYWLTIIFGDNALIKLFFN